MATVGKEVVVLVGLKGAGKTTIGQLLTRELGIHFVLVEPIFIQSRAHGTLAAPEQERLGFERVVDRLRADLATHDTVCFETTGVSVHTTWLLSELRKMARVLLVRVLAGAEESAARVRRRDHTNHLPAPDADVARINAAAGQVDLTWDATLDNRGAPNDAATIATIRDLLSRSS